MSWRRRIDERQRWDWRELVFEELTSAIRRRELHALSMQIERARRNVLRVAENSAEPAHGSASVMRTSMPPPNLESPKKVAIDAAEVKTNIKEVRTCTKTLWTPGEVFRDIDEPWCPEMVKDPCRYVPDGLAGGRRGDVETTKAAA